MTRDSNEMDRSLLRGLAWTGGIRWMSQLLSWGGTIIVARLLSPEDYGLAGMAAIYTGFTQLLCEAGLTAALLRRRDSDEALQAQLGGFAALLGVFCFLVSLALATPIAWVFGEPAVRDVVIVSSLGFIARGAQVLPRGILTRDLDFRRLALIDGGEAITLAVTTLAFALAGAGVWSLVYGPLIGGAVGAVLSFRASPQRLTWPHELRTIASDVIFGGKVLGSQLAWYAYNNSDFAVVGRLLGTSALGAYTLGWTMANVPVDRVSSLASRVTPAYFAALSDDRPALRRYLLWLTEGIATITFPACVGLAVVAPDLVHDLFGAHWEAAVTPLRILALLAAIRSIFVLAAPILVFTGQVDRNLGFSVLLVLVMPPVFAVAARWGISGVAAAWALAFPFLASILLFRHALRAVRLGWGGYVRALRSPTFATIVMAAMVLLVLREPWLPSRGLLRLIGETLVGAVAYTLTLALLEGPRLRALLSVVRGRTPPGAAPGDPTAAASRRLVVVSFHFPPDPAVGGLRWQKLARLAVERGWEVDVVTRDPRSLPWTDQERTAELPAGVRCHPVAPPRLWFADLPVKVWRALRRRPRASPVARVPSSASAESIPRHLVRWWPRQPRDLVRHYFAWLERHSGRAWGTAAARRVRHLLRERTADVIISCGPPQHSHPAIAEAAERAGIPLVLDLRDPWSLLQRIPEAVASPLGHFLARQDERRVIEGAALVVVTSDRHRDALRALHPDHAERIITVRNGSDEDPLPAASADDRFLIGYAGSVYLDRDPSPLFRAAGRLIRERGLTPDRFGIEFMGHVRTHDGVSLEEIAAQAGMGAHLTLHPPAPRTEAFAFLARTSLLVLLPQDSDFAIPAKLFEYIRFPAWILALTAPESAMGEVLRGTSARLVPPEDEEGIYRALRDAFDAHARGVHPVPVEQERPLQRRAEAHALFEALDRLDAPLASAGVMHEEQVA